MTGGVTMWKNDCSVLRGDAHHNCGRQQVDMEHLPSGTLSILCPDDTFLPIITTDIPVHLNKTGSWSLSSAKAHISGRNRQM